MEVYRSEEKTHLLSGLEARMVNNQLAPRTFSTTECLQWWALTPVVHPLQDFGPEIGGGRLPQGGPIPQTLRHKELTGYK